MGCPMGRCLDNEVVEDNPEGDPPHLKEGTQGH